MKIFIKSILIFFCITNISNADLIKPEPTLKPLDVLLIQLNSLKNNNIPYKDAGIEQTWEFAHPNNKTITGPLNRFKQMIYSKSYEILISHENSEITIVKETKNISIYKVTILSKDKKKYYYIWQVEKVLFEGDLKDCWMTTNVSNPKYIGEVI
tara:strand:- start:650 stop:1111 length:462 start_codon:yes stop_codon:yes gene_type:complete